MTTNIQSFAGDVQIDSGNLSVKSLEVKDGVTKLGSNNTSYSNVGVMMTRKDGASNVAFLFTEDGANVVLGYTNDDALEDDRIDILSDEKANLVVYGNVYVSGSVHGDGSTLTGLVTTLQSVSEFGAETDQTILFTNEITGINVSSNVLVSGNVTANVYYGDGGLLANITQTLEGITAIGNTTPYTLEFNNTDTSFVTVSNVGIGNALPTADLCVGSNVVIDDERLNKINVVGNVACHQLNLGSVEILPAYSLENVTQISNTTTNTMSFNNSTLAFDTQKMAGIGIIPSSADVGVSGLHVDGHLRLGGAADNTDNELMYIKAAGALGVLANESDTNNTITELRLQSGDTNNSNITMVGKSSAQYMTFGTNAAERMRIDSSGNVGIGTNNPVGVNGGNRLEGSSATGFEFISSRADNTTEIDDFIGAYLFKNTDTDGNAPHYCGMSAKGATTNGAMSLYFHSQRDKYELGNTPDLFIDTNGRVGVGTDDPDYTLDVVGTGGFSSNLTVGTANLHVDTTTGNVGIGVANPTKSLEINGTTLRHAYEYRYQDAWISNNNQTFTIPVTGGSARGEMLVEAEVIQVAANSSSERMARVKGIITNHHTGNFYMKVLEGENATAFETYIVGTSGSASGTFTMKYQPQQGYQQLVRCRLNLKIFIGGFTSSLGSLTRTDAGSNSDLTAPTLNSAPKIIGGNVGIGTSEPAYTLDVTGPINLTSNIVMSGEVFIKAHDATSNHVAIGPGAGQTSQGTNAVAVGYLAGQTNQHDNTVVLNASGSALNTVGTERTYIKPLRVATVASHVMTYDQTTGEVMDSGGLISNKLAIVSEQPPVALTGDSTVVDGHGRYKVTASLEAGSYQAWKCFNKSIDNADSGWSTGAVGAYNSDGTYAGSNVIAGVSGEWVKIEFPYKTTLRHVSLSPNVYYSAMPENFSIVASNDDSNWTVIKSVTGQAWTSADYVNFVINAGVAYKYYAIVAQLTNTNYAYIGEWKLFTETFTVDAGVVSTTAASGLDVGFTEHPVEPMTDYHTYVEGHGTYEASASSYDSTYSLYPWETFDNNTSTRWTISTDDDNYNVSTGEWDQTAIDASPDVFTSDVGGTRYHGHWLQIKLPYTVTLSHTNIHPQTIERAPKDGVILGSNDGEAWYKLTEFSGKTYTASTWTRIDVNATTPYQYYRMCATKNGGDSKLELTEWRLFAEKPVTRMENVHISGDLSSETLQTGYIKWPRVPLKAAESEGYVASASSGTSFAYKAFNNTISNANDVWNSASVYTNGIANGTESFEGVDGSWIKIKLPQAIQL